MSLRASCERIFLIKVTVLSPITNNSNVFFLQIFCFRILLPVTELSFRENTSINICHHYDLRLWLGSQNSLYFRLKNIKMLIFFHCHEFKMQFRIVSFYHHRAERELLIRRSSSYGDDKWIGCTLFTEKKISLSYWLIFRFSRAGLCVP